MTRFTDNSTTTDVETSLQGRVLVQVSSQFDMALMGGFASRNGLVLTGDVAADHVRTLSNQLPEATLIQDRAAYRVRNATADAPFVLPAPGLFGESSLEQVIDNQRLIGATVALTPTAHVQVGDFASLEAVINTTATLQRDDLLVHLPLDAEWLSDDLISDLLSRVERSNHPIAISLAHDRDPLTVRGVAENLHRIVDHEVPTVLMRTDLAGLDFVARGGLAAAIGSTSTLRHGLSSVRRGFKTSVRDTRTNVLLKDMLRYMRPARIETLFATPPICTCETCDGDRLERFTADSRSQDQALRHNASTLEELVAQINASGVENRRKEWRQIVRNAIAAHELSAAYRAGDLPVPHTHEVWAC